ncbi:MAG: hypothetical protein QW057_02940 [Candidatus Bathyarchaeia archaeon]
MAYEFLDLVGFVSWILVIFAGLLAFLYPFLERRREEPEKDR